MLLFLIGLVVRLNRWLRGGGFGGRRARAHGGAMREEWATREFAADVPVHRGALGGRRTREATPRGKRA